MKKLIVTSLVFLLLFSMLTFAESNDDEEILEGQTEAAVILEAEEVSQPTDLFMQEQHVKLKITSGKFKGEVFELQNQLSGNLFYDIVVKSGDKVIVLIEEAEDGNANVYISDYMRQNYAIYLGILFVLLIVVIGRKRGLKAVITLAVTLISIIKILLPAILKGMNPIPITIIISISITVFTLFVISGINPKSISAILGTTGGVLIAGLLAYYIGSQVKLTGMSSEEAIMLLYIPQGISFDFKGLLFSGIILGALGAVMDIGMSIASSIEEIYKVNPALTRKELFASGMNVGRDIMGTMTNTLILAYTGSSIPLLLLFMAYETSIIKILNLDIIATEVVRSLSGSIGLVAAIPLTALISSFLLKKKTDAKYSSGE